MQLSQASKLIILSQGGRFGKQSC